MSVLTLLVGLLYGQLKISFVIGADWLDKILGLTRVRDFPVVRACGPVSFWREKRDSTTSFCENGILTPKHVISKL